MLISKKAKAVLTTAALLQVMVIGTPVITYAADTYRGQATKKQSTWSNPIVRKGVIGAGVGLGAAALGEKSLLKGGLIGAGVGAGMGAMDRSTYFSRRPLGRRAGKGAMVGAGVGAMFGGVGALPGAALGAGTGAAIHYLKTH